METSVFSVPLWLIIFQTVSIEQPSLTAPPPWSLTGSAIVIVTHFPEAFVRANGFLDAYQQPAYRGYIGAIVLADYQTSSVGPYRELLFIPGLFMFKKIMRFSISKIYVSTVDSAWNGRENWGIPKELADFTIVNHGDGSQSYEVSIPKTNPKNTFLNIRVKPWGVRRPVTTKLVPNFGIIQQHRGQQLLTSPIATGKARLASLKELWVEPQQFPNFERISPLIIATIDTFDLTFPAPVLLDK